MNVSMLPSTVMQIILRHCDFRPVENRRLVHIIPNVRIKCTALEFLKSILISQIFANNWIKEIQIPRRTGPTPSFVIFAFTCFHIIPVGFSVVVKEVAAIPFVMWIYNRDQFTTFRCQIIVHFSWVCKSDWVPREISIRNKINIQIYN